MTMTSLPNGRAVEENDRSTTEGSGIRLVDRRVQKTWALRIDAVGSEKTREFAARAAGCEPAHVVGLSSLSHAQGWFTGHHADVLVVDSEALREVSAQWLEGFRSSPLVCATLMCVVGEKGALGNSESLRALRAWPCAYDDDDALRAFLQCGVGARAFARTTFVLNGVLPAGGIRCILPILEAERRSGRLAIEPSDEVSEQITVWIREGDPIACFAGGVRCNDPLGCAHEVADGWFCFVETAVDRDVLALLDAWSDGVVRRGVPSAAPRPPGEMRERLRVALATARTIGEMRDAVQSLLDLGIDKAAEEGDTSLMDSLADLSILLQKNKIDEAFRLLKVVLK